MPSYDLLKSLIAPEKAEAPDAASTAAIPRYISNEDSEKQDRENLKAAIQRYRSGYAPSSSPSEDKPLEQPWYMPDELIAGAVAPGSVRALEAAGPAAIRAAKYVAPEIKAATIAAKNKLTQPVANQIGALGPGVEDLIIAKQYGIKRGNTLDDLIINAAKQDPRFVTSSGHAIVDRLKLKSPEEVIEYLMGNSEIPVILKPTKKEFKQFGGNDSIAGGFLPTKNEGGIVVLNPKEFDDAVKSGDFGQLAGTIDHELLHHYLYANYPELFKKTINQNIFTPDKLEDLEQIAKIHPELHYNKGIQDILEDYNTVFKLPSGELSPKAPAGLVDEHGNVLKEVHNAAYDEDLSKLINLNYNLNKSHFPTPNDYIPSYELQSTLNEARKHVVNPTELERQLLMAIPPLPPVNPKTGKLMLDATRTQNDFGEYVFNTINSLKKK